MDNENRRVKQIDITPHKSLMPKIGQAGYSMSQAISELIDNSLDARFDGKTLTVKVTLKNSFIEVEDDGKGMDESTAEKSLKLAYSEKKNQLGEFGLGMKTACQSLGKKFTVLTTQKGSDEEYSLEFDEEEWLKNGDWTKHAMIVSKTDKEKSGTVVRVEKLRKFYPNLVTNLKEELSLRFAPYINNGELKLTVNSVVCVPKEIELTEDGKEEFEFELSDGSTIKGWRGLMKVGSNTGFYGFNTFRRGRLITQYDKIGFNPHPEVRRIIGELFMDDIPVTHNKREWIKESKEYIEMEEKMRKFMKSFTAKARNFESTTKVDVKLKEKMDVQEEIIARAIKETPELKVYAFPNVSTQKESKTPTTEEIEKRDKPEISVIQEYHEPENNKERTPKKTHLKKKYVLTINGKRFKFTHEFKDLEDKDILKQVFVTEDKGIEIFTNVSFPAFLATKDTLFYATFNIAEGLAEIMIKEKGESLERIPFLRDRILQKTGEIMRQVDEENKLIKEKDAIEKKLQERQAGLGDENE
jgi:hypothetical protein